MVVGLGDGVNREWTFDFLIPALAFGGVPQVKVYVCNTLAGCLPTVTEIDPALWTITGTDDPDGGVLTYPKEGVFPVMTVGLNIAIVRDVPYEQVQQFFVNSFWPPDVETMGDSIVLQTQQLATELTRTLRVPYGSTMTPEEYVEAIINCSIRPEPPGPVSLGEVNYINAPALGISIPESWEDYIFVQIIYGQSGAQGVSSDPASVALTTTSTYPSRVLAPFANPTGTPVPLRSPGQVADEFVVQTLLGFTNLVEFIQSSADPDGPGVRLTETPNSACGNEIYRVLSTAEFVDDAGDPVPAVDPTIVVLNVAKGGVTFDQAKRGSPPYRNALQNYFQVRDLILAAGKIPYRLPIIYAQNTADSSGAEITDRRLFAEDDANMQRMLAEDLSKCDGDYRNVPMIVLQGRTFPATNSSNVYWRGMNDYNTPPMGEVLITEIGNLIYCMGPGYPYDTYPDPGLHLTSGAGPRPGYRGLGCKMGNVSVNVAFGFKWTALRANPEECGYVSDRRFRVVLRLPNIQIPSGNFDDVTITGDEVTVGTVNSGFVSIGQSLAHAGITEEAIIIGFKSGTPGEAGVYYLRTEFTSPVGPLDGVVATPALDDPAQYTGEGVIDRSNIYVSDEDIEVSCGFVLNDTLRRFIDTNVEIIRVKEFRPIPKIVGRFFDIWYKQRPSGVGLFQYGTEPIVFNQITDFDDIVTGSGGANGGPYPITFTGGTGPLAATGTYMVTGGHVQTNSITLTEVDGITGGLYDTDSVLPTISFPQVANASAVAVFAGYHADGPNYGSRGLIRDNQGILRDEGGVILWNWLMPFWMLVPPPPFPEPNLLINGQGLVRQRAVVDLATGAYGHDRWYALQEQSPTTLCVASSTVDDDWGPFMVLSTSNPAGRQTGYAQQISNNDTVSLRNQLVSLSGYLAKTDADAALENNQIYLMMVGWTGTANLMPRAFINDYDSNLFDISSQITASLAAGVLHVTVLTAGTIKVGQRLNGSGVTTVGITAQLATAGGDISTWQTSGAQTLTSRAMTGDAMLIANTGIVPMALDITEVYDDGEVTDAFTVTVIVDETLTNFACAALSAQAVLSTEAIWLQLKLEVGNNFSGFPVETYEQTLQRCYAFYRNGWTMHTANPTATWLPWIEPMRAGGISTTSSSGTFAFSNTTAFGSFITNSVAEDVTITLSAEPGA